jgi:large subunit ribosomal protein L29
MKADKMRGIDIADLQRQSQDAQEQLFRFRFQMGMGQSEGLKKYRSLKKDRARMLTVLSQKVAQGEVLPPVSAPSAKVDTGKPAGKRRGLFGRKSK